MFNCICLWVCYICLFVLFSRQDTITSCRRKRQPRNVPRIFWARAGKYRRWWEIWEAREPKKWDQTPRWWSPRSTFWWMKSQYGSFPPKPNPIPTHPIPKTPTTKYFFRPQQPPLLPTVPPPSSFQPVNGEAEQDDDDGKKRSRLKVVATPEPNERRRGNVLQQTQIRV